MEVFIINREICFFIAAKRTVNQWYRYVAIYENIKRGVYSFSTQMW